MMSGQMQQQEDQEMTKLRQALEKEVITERFNNEVEALLKQLLDRDQNWEKDVKQKCLEKIQKENDLNKVDINKISDDIHKEMQTTFPKAIED